MVLRRSLIILFAILLPATALAAKKYVVKKGDNLYDLSKKFGLSVDELKSINNLKDNRLDIGDVLTVDDSVNGEDTTAENIARGNNNEYNNNEYIVKNGDTLGEIAEIYGLSSDDLKEANGLKNTKLQIGQKLLIPPSNADPAKVTESRETAKEGFAGEAASKAEDDSKDSSNAPVHYTVRRGDTLGHIALRHSVSSSDLKKANGLKSDNLRVGQVLVIPGNATAEVEDAPASANNTADGPVPVNTAVYTVVKGDTPGAIARSLGVSTDELIRLNNLDSRKLRIGQVLVVPGTQTGNNGEALSPNDGNGGTASDRDSLEHGAQNEAPSEYLVKNGDTLYELSKKFGVSVDRIKKYNNLKNDNLRIGQRLVLNTSGTSAAARETAREAQIESAAEAGAKYTGKYTVRRGDTLGHLALKFGVSQSELKKANGLKTSNLMSGQVLLVPGAAITEETDKVVIEETASEPVSDVYIKKRYVVKSGDTLGNIAESFGVTVEEIKKASALKSETINNGDILLIPVPQEKVTQSRYTVAKGDTLGKLGRKFGVSVSAIKKANGLPSDTLRVGMKLIIPGLNSREPGESEAESVAAAPLPRGEYVVKSGDTLGRIARRYDVTIKELKRENNIKGNSIRAGQVLYIPGYGSQETEYRAATEKSTVHESNGHYQYKEPEVENGRFSKESIIQVAKKYLGAPYKFGGNDLATGIDCSGYVKKIFSRFNVYLPRTARDIYYSSGYSIPKKNLDTGDLVFFTTYAKYPSHVGIYIGNDEFIHASSASRKVTIDSINKRYYKKRYIGAKRVQLSGLFYDELSKDYAGFDN